MVARCLPGCPRGRAYPAGAPLLVSKAGGKPAGRGISISPALHPPLKTTKKGELRFPLLGTSPELFYRQLSGRGGLRCNAPSARGRATTGRPYVGRGILDALFPSHHKHHGISAAWHRRRPGGPSWYSAATFRACKVIPMRAARGAAAPATKSPGKRAAMHARSLPCPYSPPPP